MSSKKLIEGVMAKTGMNRATTKRTLDAIAETVFDSLKAGEVVTLPNIGKVKIVDRPARTGRNPATGEEVQIPASRKVRITAIKALKQAAL